MKRPPVPRHPMAFWQARAFLYECASYTMQGTADPRALPLAIRRYVEAKAMLDKSHKAP